MSRKIIITLSGPSTAGKTTIENAIIESGIAERVLGYTSRAMRPGEVNGVDNHFVSVDEAKRLTHSEDCVHAIMHNGSLYGKTKQYFDDAFEKNNAVIAVATPEGVKQIRQYYLSDENVTVISYLVTAKTNTLIARMLERLHREPSPDFNAYAGRMRLLIESELYWGNKYRLIFTDTLSTDERESTHSNVQKIADKIASLNCAYL